MSRARTNSGSFKKTLTVRERLEHQVREIRDALRVGSDPQKSIAARYGVSPSLISRIHTNDVWREL